MTSSILSILVRMLEKESSKKWGEENGRKGN
jgi:hypothetical protein